MVSSRELVVVSRMELTVTRRGSHLAGLTPGVQEWQGAPGATQGLPPSHGHRHRRRPGEYCSPQLVYLPG